MNKSFLEQWADEPPVDPDTFDPYRIPCALPTLPVLPGYESGWVDKDNNHQARRIGWRPIWLHDYIDAKVDYSLIKPFLKDTTPLTLWQKIIRLVKSIRSHKVYNDPIIISGLIACKIPVDLYLEWQERYQKFLDSTYENLYPEGVIDSAFREIKQTYPNKDIDKFGIKWEMFTNIGKNGQPIDIIDTIDEEYEEELRSRMEDK